MTDVRGTSVSKVAVCSDPGRDDESTARLYIGNCLGYEFFILIVDFLARKWFQCLYLCKCHSLLDVSCMKVKDPIDLQG